MNSSNSETAAAAPSGHGLFALLALALALGTAALYWPITRHPFIQFDDDQYIIANPHVTSGLSATNFVWAFTTSEQANWHLRRLRPTGSDWPIAVSMLTAFDLVN